MFGPAFSSFPTPITERHTEKGPPHRHMGRGRPHLSGRKTVCSEPSAFCRSLARSLALASYLDRLQDAHLIVSESIPAGDTGMAKDVALFHAQTHVISL